jgi:hypothetical protein
MLQKVLGWSTLGLTLVFVVLSLAVMFASGSLGGATLALMAPIAIASLAVAILLAVAMLVLSLVQ